MPVDIQVQVFLRTNAPQLTSGALTLLLRDHLVADDCITRRGAHATLVAFYDVHLDMGVVILGGTDEVEAFLDMPDFSGAHFSRHSPTPPELTRVPLDTL